MKKQTLFKLMGFWPPYFGAGVKVTHVSHDLREIDVQMKLRFWNRNYVGTHFGGSLYSMTDPFIMLMLMENLGRDYIVWDKEASIKFKTPGRTNVYSKFRLSEEKISEIKNLADTQYKVEPTFIVEVFDENGDLVAEVEKLLYVKRKDRKKD